MDYKILLQQLCGSILGFTRGKKFGHNAELRMTILRTMILESSDKPN